MRLAAIYGHKFTSLFPDADALQVAKSEWSSALAGLSDYQLANAFKRCQRREGWPPTTGEFIRLAAGLPSQAEAVARVIAKNIIDPVTRNILTAIGSWELKRLETDKLARRASAFYNDALESALDEVIGLAGDWQAPQQIAQEKAPEEVVKADPEVAEGVLRSIKSKLKNSVQI